MATAAEPKLSVLAYGYAGSGKTAFAVSSMWDWKKAEQLRKGKVIWIGREDNPALAVPEDMVIRLSNPLLDTEKFVDQFKAVMRGLYKANTQALAKGKPVPVEAIVLDGMSEFDMLYEETFKASRADEFERNKFSLWNQLQTELFAAMQMLDPTELGCHIVVTARVAERREAKEDRRGAQIAEGDPVFMDTAVRPAIKGGFKVHFPHYFQFVLYFERVIEAVKVEGRGVVRLPRHKVNMIPNADALVKNHYDYFWAKAGLPFTLTDIDFDDLLRYVQELRLES